MSESFTVKLQWNSSNEFVYDKFSRDHDLTLSQDQHLHASSAASYLGNSKMTNPEELLTSALASCHMLTFLAIASKSGYTIESYLDNPEALLDKNEEGKLSITTINLKPEVVFKEDKIPSPEQLKSLHEKAHRNCFIANSIKTHVNIL